MIENGSNAAARQDEASADLLSVHAGSCLQRAHREMLETTVILASLSTVVGATLIYSITGPLGIEVTLRVGGRLLYIGLCGLICWPLCHSLNTTLLYLTRRRKPHQIVLVAIAGAGFMAVACTAVAYTVIGVSGTGYVGGFADIYLNVFPAVAACNTVVYYTAWLRARLRFAAEAASSAVGAKYRDASSVETAGSPHASDSGDVVGDRDTPEATPTEAHHPNRQAPSDRISIGTPPDEKPQSSARAAASSPEPISETQAESAKRPRFLDRLPESLGHDVIYLNVSGHYVNAVTTQGAGVILMRFADAIAELDDMGLQVHRSYWVAHRHINAILRRDERTLVRVTGDQELPVSRTHLTAVRALIPHVGRGQQIGLEHPGD